MAQSAGWNWNKKVGLYEKKKLLIVKNNLVNLSSNNEQETISFDVFKSWATNISLFYKFFSYTEVGLKVYSIDFQSSPFITFLLLRFLSKKTPFIMDDKGKKKYITLAVLIQALIRYTTDWLKKGSVVRQVEEQLLKEQRGLTIVKKARITLNQKPSVYLRTDLWFGVFTGGSVGHIAGVLNQMDQFSGSTILLSTDYLPTVRDDITLHLIEPVNHYWDFQELPSIASNTCFNEQAIRIIGNLKPSFIYQRYSLNNFTGISLSNHFQIPFVLEYNGSEVWIARNWGKPLKYEELSRKIEKLNLKAADLVVAVSKQIKEELVSSGIEAEKILVNPNGVDPDRYSPNIDGGIIREQYKLENKVVIGFMGTFGRWHGAEVLAEAFGHLLQTYPNYRESVALLMIGDGLRMQQVKINLSRFNVENQSILTGLVSQNKGPEYLAACDILVSPHIPNQDGTPFFGSPTKIFEYMAMGKGILASDLDQIGEVLEHGRTAWLVQPGDATALSIGLKELIENSSLRQQLGKEARQEVIAKYTWREHTRRIIEKLRERCGE